MNQPAFRRFVFISILVLSTVSFAQQPAPSPAPEAPKDTITRIFTGEFSERPSPPPRWFEAGNPTLRWSQRRAATGVT